MSALYYTDEDGNPLRPPRWWLGYLTGAILTFLGLVVPCGGLMVIFATHNTDHGVSIKPPGSGHISVDRPRPMILWVQEDSEPFANITPVVPADLHITVTGPGPKGQSILVRSPGQETTSYVRGSTRLAIGLFDPPAAGDYTFAVKGTFQPQQTVAASTDELGKETVAGLGAMLVLLIGGAMLLAGIVTLIVTTVKHIKHQRQPF